MNRPFKTWNRNSTGFHLYISWTCFQCLSTAYQCRPVWWNALLVLQWLALIVVMYMHVSTFCWELHRIKVQEELHFLDGRCFTSHSLRTMTLKAGIVCTLHWDAVDLIENTHRHLALVCNVLGLNCRGSKVSVCQMTNYTDRTRRRQWVCTTARPREVFHSFCLHS